MTQAPIAMILFCPACGDQHVDKAEPDPFPNGDPGGGDLDVGMRFAASRKRWINPPHRSHRCEYCGYIWRPADVETVGVAEIHTKGKADSQPPIRRVRNTGKTTQQMRDAPEGAVFVWVSDDLGYAHHLSRYLGRADLKITCPNDLHRVRPPLSGIVVDHAANLSGQQWAIIETLKTYVR